jgi:putative ABC transport system substrate-binding protein
VKLSGRSRSEKSPKEIAMKRRQFVTWLGSVATLPLAARAQPSAMPVIGFLHAGSREENAKRLAAFLSPVSPLAEPFIKEVESGAASLGIKLEILRASNDAELGARFAALPEGPGNVMVLGPDAFFYTRREKIAALAARHVVPSIYDDRAYVDAGGLVNYGADWMKLMELTGGYAARVLKGEKPADLPIQQATKFEMLINLKTAKALGLSVPQKLLLLADDVIE